MTYVEPARYADLRAGARAMAPLTLAYVPFGLVVGATVAASANPLAAWLATWTIYGGAAQLAVLNVLSQGSGWPAAVVVGLLVNARLVAYATAMAGEWRTAGFRQRVAAGLLLTDAPWGLARGRASGPRQFYLGAALTLFGAWPALVTAGVLVGGWVDAVPVTALLPAITLGSVVVRQLRDRPALTAVLAATLCAVLTSSQPAGLSLALAGAVGAGAGLVAGRAR